MFSDLLLFTEPHDVFAGYVGCLQERVVDPAFSYDRVRGFNDSDSRINCVASKCDQDYSGGNSNKLVGAVATALFISALWQLCNSRVRLLPQSRQRSHFCLTCIVHRNRKRRAKASTPMATPSSITVTPPSGTPAPCAAKRVHPVSWCPAARNGIMNIPLKLPTYQISEP